MIIVFGSNVVDLFFHVKDLPAEDQAVHIATHYEAPGGKGQNQAVAAAKAGAQVRFFGALGDGAHGRSLIENLQACKINTSGIEIFKEHPTSVATIFVDDNTGKHRVVVSQGANAYAVQSHIPDDLLNRDTVLLLQAELSLDETATLMSRARTRNCKAVILNLAPPKPLTAEMVANIDYLVMNEHEAGALRKFLKMAEFPSYEELAKAFNTLYGVKPIITLGENGVVAFDGETMHRIPALKIKAVDTLGAGDAFCGMLAACIDRDMPFADALRHASIAGSLACTKHGAQTALPSMDEVRAKLSELGAATATSGNRLRA